MKKLLALILIFGMNFAYAELTPMTESQIKQTNLAKMSGTGVRCMALFAALINSDSVGDHQLENINQAFDRISSKTLSAVMRIPLKNGSYSTMDEASNLIATSTKWPYIEYMNYIDKYNLIPANDTILCMKFSKL